MELNKDRGKEQNVGNLKSNEAAKNKKEQPVFALGLDNNWKKENLPFLFPWNCKKDSLYPETNYLCNIKNMALHDQLNTIRTYISSVFTGKSKPKK